MGAGFTAGVLDFEESAVTVAPVGILRLRRKGGILEISIDGSAYTNLLDIATGDLADGAVTMAKLADVATATVFGRVAASTGVPKALTQAELTTLINAATASLPGAFTAADFSKLLAMYRPKP